MNKITLSIITLMVGLLIFCPLYSDSPISIVRSTNDNVTIEFVLPNFDISRIENYTYISCPDLEKEEIEGKIDLPYYSFLIGVPQNGDVRQTIISVDDHSVDISAPIAPYPTFKKDPLGETSIKKYIYIKEDYLFEKTNKSLEVSEPYLWRQQQIVQVILRPFTVENNKLKIIDKIKLSFSISGNKKLSPFTDKNFETIFENSIVNFDIAKNWSVYKDKKGQFDPFSQADRWFRIQISETGICKITKQMLSSVDADVENLNPNQIKVFNGGGFSQDRSVGSTLYPLEEIPVFVEESGSDFTIYFYVRNTDGYKLNKNYNQYYNPYTGENTYWLTYNTNLSLSNKQLNIIGHSTKKETINTYTYSEHFEEEHVRTDPLSIKWYWASFIGSGGISKYFDFNVSNLDISKPQELTIKFNYTPSIKTYVNGILLTDTDYAWKSSTVTYTGNFLKNGNNELKLVTTSGSNKLYFDYFEVSYTKSLRMEDNYISFSLPEDSIDYTVNVSNVSSHELNVFKVTDFNQATKITNYNLSGSSLSFNAISVESETKFYIVNSGGYIIPDIEEKFKPELYYNRMKIDNKYLRDDSTLANVEAIIITPEEYWEQSKELANVHVLYDGLNVLVVNINDVYDEFSWGLTDVVSIRYFLNYVYDYYALDPEKQLSYVLLMGDGTNDFRGYEQGSEERNKILPFVNETTVSDDYFTYFAGKYDPYLMIGRFPGYTDTQMEVMVEKSINYIANPEYGYWRNRVILCADDFLKSGSHSETDNTKHADSCSVKIEESVEVVKVYGIRYPLDQFNNRPEANEDLIKKINEGAAIFYYVGHGGYDVMGDEEYFRASRDISKLNNKNMLNFFLASSCDIGYFFSNTYDCTAERMIYTKDRGSVAAFASTKKAWYGPCLKVVDMVVNRANLGITIGEAVMIGKTITGYSYPHYMLFGDPMLCSVIPVMKGDITIPEQYADSLKARQTGSMCGIIDTTGYEFSTVYNVIFDTDYIEYFEYVKGDTIDYLPVVAKGKAIFKGPVSVTNKSFNVGFVIPDDVLGGHKGHMLSYSVGSSSNENVEVALRYNKREDIQDHNLIINGYAEAVNDGPPRITMWLDNDNFKSGDYVSASPLVYIEIIDSNGVNITNYPGHRILLTIDNEDEYNITEHFVYNLDSYIKGSIEYQLESIPAGIHTMLLEVFDNLNEVAFEEVEFKIKSPDDIEARTVLNYPNPMSDHTYFTFYLDGDATVDIEVFTVAGKRIKTIEGQVLQAGYNQVFWDGRDDDGDIPSNGVYFYKLIVNGKRIEDIFKIIIFH